MNNKRIVIVEGVDRVGKSTLCSKLADKLKIGIYHDTEKLFYNETNEGIDLKFEALMNYIKYHKGNILFDRFHLTELVYDSLRGQSFNSYKDIDEQLSKMDTTLILVLSEDIDESSRQHGKDLCKHQNAFINEFMKSKIKNKLFVNYKHFDKFMEDNFNE